MSKMFVGILFALLAASIAAPAFAHSPAMHAYIGQNTIGVWNSFDANFVTCFNRIDHVGCSTKKWYYIGLTMPDMFEVNTQEQIYTLLMKFYNIRNNMPSNSPLYIIDNTMSQTVTRMDFNGQFPNNNVSKLRDMAIYARDHGYAYYERALIYGVYMHVVQDLCAHMVQQPNSFGYGFTVNPDGVDLPDPVSVVENYHELFATTHIANWDFIKYMYMSKKDESAALNYGTGLDFYPIYNVIGQYRNNWQSETHNSCAKFVEAAANVGYAGPSLTQARLEAYMHGWAITLFFMYGYTGTSHTNPYTNIGGAFSHPFWSPNTIADYVGSIAIEDGGVNICSIPILCDIATSVLYKLFKHFDMGLGDLVLWGHFWGILEYSFPGGTRPWTSYFETPGGLDVAWSCVPESFRPQYQQSYEQMRSVVQTYNDLATGNKPNLRSTYQNEPQRAIDLWPVYKNCVDYGAFDYSANICGINVG